MKFPRNANSYQKISMIAIVVVVAGLGIYSLLGSRAQTPYASVAASSGTTANGALAQACSGSIATSGQCVVFNGASSGGGGGTTGGGGGSTTGPWIGLNGFDNWGGTYNSPYGSGTTSYQDLYYHDGFRWGRLEVDSAYTANNALDSALSAGFNVMLIVPEDTTAAMSWMSHYNTPQYASRIVYEFGNEPFYNGVPVATYAQEYQATYNAKHAAGITQPLLFMTAGALQNYGCPTADKYDCYWLEGAMLAVPNLQVDGFSMHPYGQAGDDDNGDSNGVVALNNLHANAVSKGFANQPWYVTEYGFTLCDPHNGCSTSSPTPNSWYVPSYQQQAQQLILGFNAMMAYGDGQSGTWLKGIMWYQPHDDGTGAFGLVTDETASGKDNAGEKIGNSATSSTICLRPSYTALKAFLTSTNVNPATATSATIPATCH